MSVHGQGTIQYILWVILCRPNSFKGHVKLYALWLAKVLHSFVLHLFCTELSCAYELYCSNKLRLKLSSSSLLLIY